MSQYRVTYAYRDELISREMVLGATSETDAINGSIYILEPDVYKNEEYAENGDDRYDPELRSNISWIKAEKIMKYVQTVENWRFDGYCMKKGDIFEVVETRNSWVTISNQYFNEDCHVPRGDLELYCEPLKAEKLTPTTKS